MKSAGIIFTAVFVLLYLCCGNLWAAPTTANQAAKVVTGWLKADAQPFGAALGQKLKKTDVFRDEQGQVIYYIVYLQPAGFVIVPADDTIEPILGFAEAGTYDPSPDNPLGALVNQDVKSRISASRDISTAQGADAKALQKMASKWQRLTADSQQSEGPGILGLPLVSDLRVNPLLRTKWSQTTCCDTPRRACYNFYTPPFLSGDPNNYPCGCVATAMAQLMRFYAYPTAGIGKLQFQIRVNGNLQLVWTRGGDGLGGPYVWTSMVYEPNCSTTGPQCQAVGALCYDAGVSVNMNYFPLPAGSAAFLTSAKTALKNTFTYSNAFYKNTPGISIPVAALIKMINPNLDYEHPVLIGIQPGPPGQSGGHAVVVDGYGYNLYTMYHHINMGWAGVQDAWYNFYSDMPPSYTYVDCCVYNIFVMGTNEIISGRVTDAYGNALAGETVTAARTDGGTYSATTNDRGIYVLAHVPGASIYTVSVTKPGYGFSSQIVSTGTSADVGTIGNVWAVDFSPFGANTIFVDVNATGNDDGSNWTDAYNYLRDAISAASSDKIIVVAEGTYKPDANSANPAGDGDRFKTFYLQSGVAIYGGFPSGGSNNWSDRDINTNQTILSGDIGAPNNNSDNSYHIVSGGGTNSTAVLDGFTIKQGNANGAGWVDKFGAGIYNNNGSPTIRNCTFMQNAAEAGASAIWNYDHGDASVTNCTFVGNGGYNAVQNRDSNVVFTACVFSENSGCALFTSDSSTSRITGCRFIKNTGGAIQNYRGTHQIVNCIFFGNSAQNGGGIWNRECSPRITNCVFSGNTASGYGGGVYNRPESSPTLTNCTFCDNHASIYGGGIYNDSLMTCAPTITNCIVWCNSDVSGTGAASQIYDGTPSVKFSCIQDNNPNDANIPFGGAANHNIDDNPLFERAPYDGGDGWGNANDDYGDLHLSPISPCIDDGNNTAVPADTTDLDADGDTTEQTPLDLDLRSRFADGDCNSIIVVDMGAYEFSWAFIGDFDHNCSIDFIDYAVLASDWLENNPLLDITPPPAGDGIVDFKDLAVLCDHWLAGK